MQCSYFIIEISGGIGFIGGLLNIRGKGLDIMTYYLVQASYYNELYATKNGEVETEILQS